MNKIKNKKIGWIEIIAGPMFAGKTEEILRRIRRLIYAKKNYIVFKSKIDRRYSSNEIVSHIKNKLPAIIINKSNEILKYIKKNTDVIVIDEIQFFDKNIINICEELANKGKRVIVAGLDTDFRGEPFEIVASLLCKAEHITKLTSICAKCGNEATRSQRIINNKPARYCDPVFSIGEKDKYEPRCRNCHQILKK